MFDTINQAKNAIEAYDAALKVNNANIANQSVPGYKRLDVSFQSILERTLNIGTSTTNPLQLGQGVGIAGINIDTTAGGIVDSIYKTDAAITGQGFFVVSGDGGNTFQYTRAGK